MEKFFIGRQAIFDRQMQVFAYELLYRESDENSANPIDGERATSLVLLNSFAEFGIQRLVGDAKVFINLTRNFFIEEHPIPLDTSRVVLEILEDIPVDAALIESVQKLTREGYSLALDDFDFDPKWAPLIEHVDFIKVEVPSLDWDGLEQKLDQLPRERVKLLAEKVETLDEYRRLHDLGFDYFQGYFFAKPTVVSGQRLGENQQLAVALLAKINDPQTTTKDLERIITQDAGFSFKILRYLNSAAAGMPRKVSSIHQAIIYLGLRQIRAWANLIVLSGIGAPTKELFNTALVRAHMCARLLTESKQPQFADPGFTTGLLSIIDVLMGQKMHEVLASVHLANDIRDALLTRQGPVGLALACALAYEQQQWDQVKYQNLTNEQISNCYLASAEAALSEYANLLGEPT